MAISVRATSTGPSNNSTTTSISLPSGTTTGDVTFICYKHELGVAWGGTTIRTYTAPSGWTVLVASNSVIVCYRAFQVGDPTTGITATSSAAGWWESIAITYSGADTASPVDTSNPEFQFNSNFTGTQARSICRAPSVCPNYNGSQLLCIFAEGGSSGKALSLPAGLTARVNTAIGPNIRMADKTLTDGTITGPFDSTVTSPAGNVQFGMQIAVKASGAAGATLAAAQPVVSGFATSVQNVSTRVIPLEELNVQDGDMVCVFMNGPDAVTSVPTGFTGRSTTLGAQLYTKLWATGDSKAPSFGFGAINYKSFDVALVRKMGVSANPVSFDTQSASSNSGIGSAVGTAPSITPAGANELLFVYIGTQESAAGAWSSVTGGLIDEDICAGGPNARCSWVQGAASPTGTFSATNTHASTVNIAALSALFKVGSGGGGGGSSAVGNFLSF